ncbi:MAG: threonine-phosphate decarboxylase CobD [Pseudomonadota bacterium]
MSSALRDHGGGLDAAARRYGGSRSDWIDLSTGINPAPYPVGTFQAEDWTALPDAGAFRRLEAAARSFWRVPADAGVLAAPGASALIARIPALFSQSSVDIPAPTYNEHAAAFRAHGWSVDDSADLRVIVHPNNPDGRFWDASDLRTATIIDESFCDIAPARSLIDLAGRPGTIVLKSFGKFWGLAGLRLGFAIGDPTLIAKLRDFIGPWAVSGPALRIGATALEDHAWASATRERLTRDAARLDRVMLAHGADIAGGTPLFRLYDTASAQQMQDKLARAHIWSRIFPYSERWLRLGLPPADGWDRLKDALA